MSSGRTEVRHEGRLHPRHRGSPSLGGLEEGGTLRGHQPEQSPAGLDGIQMVWRADCAHVTFLISHSLGYYQDLKDENLAEYLT